jgi:hypothetical protein
MILVGLFVLQARRSKRDFVGVCRLERVANGGRRSAAGWNFS